jgi:dTDP-4-dehydrorhamnose 3,5-epimerase-like enzyme
MLKLCSGLIPMAYTIELQTITDDSARLTVIEKILPFEIKRVYYLYNISEDAIRGRHGHRKAITALISLNGTCVVKVIGSGEQRFVLDRPNLCLVCLPEDWHEITDFSEGAVLLVLSSEYYDPTEYIYEKPE